MKRKSSKSPSPWFLIALGVALYITTRPRGIRIAVLE
jgi:hypothetical protein